MHPLCWPFPLWILPNLHDTRSHHHQSLPPLSGYRSRTSNFHLRLSWAICWTSCILHSKKLHHLPRCEGFSTCPRVCNRFGFMGGVVSPWTQPPTWQTGWLCFRSHHGNCHLVALYNTLASRQPYSSNHQGLHSKPHLILWYKCPLMRDWPISGDLNSLEQRVVIWGEGDHCFRPGTVYSCPFFKNGHIHKTHILYIWNQCNQFVKEHLKVCFSIIHLQKPTF